MGMIAMITTDQAHIYGEELGFYQSRLSDWIRQQNIVYRKNKEANQEEKNIMLRNSV